LCGPRASPSDDSEEEDNEDDDDSRKKETKSLNAGKDKVKPAKKVGFILPKKCSCSTV
jgi:hypothetical protein